MGCHTDILLGTQARAELFVRDAFAAASAASIGGTGGALQPEFSAGSTDVEESTDTSTRTQLAPNWNVIALDDPVTLMSYVTMVLQKVFGYSLAQANKLMMEVHNSGRAIVWTGAREQAEMYIAKLHGFQLLAKLERVPS